MSKIQTAMKLFLYLKVCIRSIWRWKEIRLACRLERLINPCKDVLIALDVTEEVVDEAIQLGANVIIAHHPLILTR